MLDELKSLSNVSDNFVEVVKHQPLITGDSLPEYWTRVDEHGNHYIFLAQWKSKKLMYPVYSGQSFMSKSVFSELSFNVNDKIITKNIEFKPYQSVLLKISKAGEVEEMDISFVPKTPIIRPKKNQKMNF